MLNKLFLKMGEFCLIKKNIFLVFIFLALFICLFFLYGINRSINLKNSINKIRYLEQTALSSVGKRKKIKDFLDKKTIYDVYFIDNNLENLLFLEKEKTDLSSILSHPAFSLCQTLKERLDFLNNGQNKLKFAEENIKKTSSIKETDEIQLHPIELDENDLENLLSTIEEIKINSFKPKNNSPQLIIKKFLLKKEKENAFSLEMKLLKREFLKG